MRGVGQLVDTGSRTLSYLLGGLVVILAVAVMATSTSVPDITSWVNKVFGITFVLLLGGLVFTALFCWVRITHDSARPAADGVWLEAGLQAASGITTLALTYTLLGISLGIGSLAGQDLNPETVQYVIRGLTDNFSLAFMTTVVGLPISAVLRTMLLVTNARNRQRAIEAKDKIVVVPAELPAGEGENP